MVDVPSVKEFGGDIKTASQASAEREQARQSRLAAGRARLAGLRASAINQPAGTLTLTSAETGEVFGSRGERKTAGVVSQVQRLGQGAVGVGKIDEGTVRDVQRLLAQRETQRGFGGEIRPSIEAPARVRRGFQVPTPQEFGGEIRPVRQEPPRLEFPQAPLPVGVPRGFGVPRVREFGGEIRRVPTPLERARERLFAPRLLPAPRTPTQQLIGETVFFGAAGIAIAPAFVGSRIIQSLRISRAAPVVRPVIRETGRQTVRRGVIQTLRGELAQAPIVPRAIISAGTGIVISRAGRAGTEKAIRLQQGEFAETSLELAREAQKRVVEQQTRRPETQGQLPVLQRFTTSAPSLFKGLALQISPIALDPFTQSKEQFRERSREILRSQGVPESEIEQRVKLAVSARKQLGLTEFGTQVIGAERASEIFGRAAIKKAFKEGAEIAGKKLTARQLEREIAKRTIGSFALGGAVEGTIAADIQSTFRREPITPTQRLLAAGLGAGTGVFFGVPTTAFQVTRPTISKLFGTTANVLDAPFETFGDVTANAQQSAIRRALRQPTEQAAILRRGQKFGLTTVKEFEGISEQFRPQVRKPSRVRIVAPSGLPSLPTLSGVPSPQVIPTPTRTRIKSVSEIVEKQIKEQQRQQVRQQENIQQQQRQQVQQQQQVTQPQKQEVNVQVGLPSEVPVSIPLFTQVFGIRGFLPPPLPFPSSSKGGGGGASRRVFVNELAESQKLFRDALNINIGTLFKPLKKRASKGRSRKK